MSETNAEKRLELMKYVIGSLVAAALLIGGYWATRAETANAKYDSISERVVRIETDAISTRADICEIKDSLKEIERLLREKK